MEKLIGIIQRVTYHNKENGWTVLKVSPLDKPHELKAVTVHQANVFAGATFEFEGEWVQHPKYGEQFKSHNSFERKPASASALEKYIGSGLIYGVGPKIAKRIVKYFGKETLDVFEHNIERLKEVTGIAQAKLDQIQSSWTEHREIRNVMLFLQEYGVSTLFAVKIFKTYGNEAINIVKDNPYQLSKDIYGIGFFSADKIALSMGVEKDSPKRMQAAVSHVLAAAREQGHCYLELPHIQSDVEALLKEGFPDLLVDVVHQMEEGNDLKIRLKQENDIQVKCYYSKSLYYDELYTAETIKTFLSKQISVDSQRVKDWLSRFNEQQEFPLSDEQFNAVLKICQQAFSILTGGPGCGKTTTTKALVKLLLAMKKRVTLATPTGRAAQRMSEVIGREAKTIHRLLVWQPHTGQFKKNKEEPLETDFVIIDECSMLDISISASLLRAIPETAQVLFIGDPNQLPSVGAGNVLKDLIESGQVPYFHLEKIFRQANQSQIIKFAHQIIRRQIPPIESPIHVPDIWNQKVDCLFLDSEEANKEQLLFIKKIRKSMRYVIESEGIAFVREQRADDVDDHYKSITQTNDIYINNTSESEIEELRKKGVRSYIFNVPTNYLHADIQSLLKSESDAEALKNIIKGIHPWSSLNYGFTASEMVVRLYVKTIKERLGCDTEVQILTPMTVGSMGTRNLNQLVQDAANPIDAGKASLQMGERTFRTGDRVIQRRNNYDLEVFNGDIGQITSIDSQNITMEISYASGDNTREIHYEKQDILDIDLAYAITIHKSQGSEFDAVIIPVVLQHFNMLYQNLIYTALTRAKKMAIFVGTRKALGIAVKNIDNRSRKTMLNSLLRESEVRRLKSEDGK
ncbi:SF1B family DNA helicase RecD2 [Saccharicrinis fermentans]|uniref:Exodeoxyribonuclease V alpha chain n=1 Tax=Saccharicrinis fermentans DSM 9555 = JCM 21142 TaxID=869213 RepID=W7XYQ1_9BACT|nr:AAA family ATPase [Saccharicrinis fermentans]GAF03760.1 exodeoxyribonuclease V alpha chain [Saccharicrinis fermentans DSM 9555 = JCM 21142]